MRSIPRRTWGGVVGTLTLALCIVPACRPATQVTLTISYEGAGCRDIAIAVAAPELVGTSEPSTTTPCVKGRVGTLVLVPSSSKPGPVGVVVYAGLTKSAEECRLSPDGCIVARRRFSFAEHVDLSLPIVLSDACVPIAKTCRPDETCDPATLTCVPSDTSCIGDVCGLPGEPLPDGGTLPPVDGGGVDASTPRDAAFEASLKDVALVPLCTPPCTGLQICVDCGPPVCLSLLKPMCPF